MAKYASSHQYGRQTGLKARSMTFWWPTESRGTSLRRSLVSVDLRLKLLDTIALAPVDWLSDSITRAWRLFAVKRWPPDLSFEGIRRRQSAVDGEILSLGKFRSRFDATSPFAATLRVWRNCPALIAPDLSRSRYKGSPERSESPHCPSAFCHPKKQTDSEERGVRGFRFLEPVKGSKGGSVAAGSKRNGYLGLGIAMGKISRRWGSMKPGFSIGNSNLLGKERLFREWETDGLGTRMFLKQVIP